MCVKKPRFEEAARAGLERRCTTPDCGEVHFPRINPATIMLVQDPSGERCVMARNHNLSGGGQSTCG